MLCCVCVCVCVCSCGSVHAVFYVAYVLGEVDIWEEGFGEEGFREEGREDRRGEERRGKERKGEEKSCRKEKAERRKPAAEEGQNRYILLDSLLESILVQVVYFTPVYYVFWLDFTTC